MIYLFDTCSLINLSNGCVLGNVLALQDIEVHICPAVLRESRSIQEELRLHLSNDEIALIDDSRISARRYLALKGKYALGDGETESIVYAEGNVCKFVCDDLAARKAGIDALGEGSITGTIGIIRLCVEQNLITKTDGFHSYQLMLAQGGFLPKMSYEEIFPNTK